MYVKKIKIAILSLLGIVLLFVGLCLYKGIDLRGINSADELVYRVMNRFAHRSEVDDFFARLYPIEDKFWLHCTNSVDKFKNKGTRYNGVELDIVYYPEVNNFDNSHDAAEEIKYPLENMLRVLGENDQKIWLDYKNLTSENAIVSRKRLEELLSVYGIEKKRCIVESDNYIELKYFHEYGFYTSYYAYSKNTPEQFKEDVKQAADSGNVDAVSTSWENYELLKESKVDKDLLLWDARSRWWAFFLESKRNKIRQDDAVKVILVVDYGKEER